MDYQSQGGYGYAATNARASTGGIRPVVQSQPGHYQPANNQYAHPTASPQQQGGYGAPTGYGPPPGAGGIARVDRSAQINDYVARQKQAKLNAPILRKENQRLAEQRAISASRGSSKSNEPADDYLDDHSSLAPPQDEYHRNGGSGGRPVSGPVNARGSGMPQQSPVPDRRQSGGIPATQPRMSGATKTVTYESDREPAGNGGGASGGGPSNAELIKRVGTLEEQVRLLKQQNRIFLSFMQNTEQQLMEMRSGAVLPAAAQQQQPERSRSRAGMEPAQAAPASSGGAYPNNMSEKTKQVLQRSQSERHTQPPSSSAGRVVPPAAQDKSSPSFGGISSGGDFDQTFAPLDDPVSREKERLRSAKKKAGLLNLREKMAQKQGSTGGATPGGAGQQEMSAGRGYKENQYQEYDDPPQNAGYGYAGGANGNGAVVQSSRQPASAAASRGSGAQRGSGGQVPASAKLRPSAAAPPPPAEQDEDEYGDGGGAGFGGNDSFGGSGVPVGADEVVETFPCPNCDRRFNQAALAKHVAKQLCKTKPRKVFNMAQKRLLDLAAEAREAGIKLPTKPIIPVVGAGGAPVGNPAALASGLGSQKSGRAAASGQEAPLKKKAKWRVDHEKFMEAIKAGKVLQNAVANGIPLSSLPPPVTREEDDDRTPCPHCGRKFQSNVADRHIPHCKNTRNKPKATAASAARLGGTQRR